MAKLVASSRSFFKMVPLNNWIFSLLLFAVLHLLSYQRDMIDPQKLPHEALRSAYHWAAYEHHSRTTMIYHFLIGAHLFEASLATVMALSKGVGAGATFKWFVQTLVNGFFSLKIILSYSPDKPKRR